jgi:hypothetical protein
MLFHLGFDFVYLNGAAVFVMLVVELYGQVSNGTLNILWLFVMAGSILNIIWLLFYVNYIGKKRERMLK